MQFPKIWKIIDDFKALCQGHGWKASENEDWVYANENYHNFIWTRMTHPSTFRKINVTQKCAAKEGLSYKVVDTSFTAWLFLQKPQTELISILQEEPSLLKKTAVYDLSEIYGGKPVCVKHNNTASIVFQKFEKFLQDRGIKMKQMTVPSPKPSKRNPENLLVVS